LPYIFGYGSLIEQASRLKSTPSALYVLPSRARGYVRGWWHRTGVIGFSTTFLGAIPAESGYMNGVIYAVDEQELDATDKREIGYLAATGKPLRTGRDPHSKRKFKYGKELCLIADLLCAQRPPLGRDDGACPGRGLLPCATMPGSRLALG
jgi:hypothetical protein